MIGWRQCLALWGLLAFASCGGSPDALPPTTVASLHFRYHSDTWRSDISGVRSALEANRSDVFSYFGLSGDDVVDYYLSYGAPDRCVDESNCAMDRQVFTDNVFDRHNLIHAYLAGTGNPPRAIREGVAEAVTCYDEDRSGEPAFASWQDLFRVPDDTSPEFYATCLRLVRYLLLHFGPARFMDYYRSTPATTEASAFAADFQTFWSLSVDEAWAMANSTGDVAPSPICPCRLPPIVAGAAPLRVPDLSYVPVVDAPSSSVMLTLSSVNQLSLRDCDRRQAPVILATGDGIGINVMQLDAERRYLLAKGGFSTEATLSVEAPLESECSATRSLLLDYSVQQLAIVVPRGASPSYLAITTVDAAVLTRLTAEGASSAFRLCSDCSLSDCMDLPPAPDPKELPPTGTSVPTSGAILEVDPSGLSGAGLASFIATVDFL